METIAWDLVGPLPTARKILRSSSAPLKCTACNGSIIPGQVFVLAAGVGMRHDICPPHLRQNHAAGRDLILSAAFLDALIKRSADAELCLQDSGRIRFQRALLAAVELYQEQCPPGGHRGTEVSEAWAAQVAAPKGEE